MPRAGGKPFVGVELVECVGLNNGSVRGESYFTCGEGHGIFAAPENVRKVEMGDTDADEVQKPPQTRERSGARLESMKISPTVLALNRRENVRRAIEKVTEVAMWVDASIESKLREREAVEQMQKWSTMLPPRYAASRRLIFEGTVDKHYWYSPEAQAAGLPPDYTTKKHLMLFSDCLAQ